MTVLLVFLIVVGVKLPLLAVGWVLYRAINDTPDPEVDRDGGEYVRATFEPGPRRRGPHSGGPAAVHPPRRGDQGHHTAQPKQPAEHKANGT